MKFGIMFDTHIDKWELIRYAEELGYDTGWVPDSQMIWSDCYAMMALAAVNTKRIRIGTGVAIPGTRIAPVTAHSIATINQIAPGRVFLGIGTGHTAMRVMGQDPMPIREFREYLRVVRALLMARRSNTHIAAKPARYSFSIAIATSSTWITVFRSMSRPMALRRWSAAANTATAGSVTGSRRGDPPLEQIQAGAKEAGRKIGPDFYRA